MFSIALIILIHFFYYSFLIAIFLQIIYFFNYKENEKNGRIKILHYRGSYILVILILLILIYIYLGGKIYDLKLMGLEHW